MSKISGVEESILQKHKGILTVFIAGTVSLKKDIAFSDRNVSDTLERRGSHNGQRQATRKLKCSLGMSHTEGD